MAEVMKYDPKRGAGAIDRVLLRGASSGKSPQEMSALTGGIVSPAKAAQRVRDILASRDWLTQLERKQLLIDDLMAIKDTLYKKVVDHQNTEAAGPLIKVLSTIGKVIAEDKIDLSEVLTQIRKAHASLMLSAIEVALERSLLELEKRYPDVPAGELTEIFHIAMPEAVRAIEAKVKKDD